MGITMLSLLLKLVLKKSPFNNWYNNPTLSIFNLIHQSDDQKIL